ncbi:hypothetical protein HTZ32_000375, partial [Campylobacter coli]|nr:hypothetical protein [Campylobacter coli]EFU7094214.1 hypothetical protein [Campylobacter coli]
MKSILYMLILFFSLLNADELDNALKNNQNKWQKFNYQATQKAPTIKEENIDFKSALNGILSNVLENKNGIDKTDGNLDFQNENVQIKNLNSLYEG